MQSRRSTLNYRNSSSKGIIKLFTSSHLGAGVIVITFGENAILVWPDKIKPSNIAAFGFLAVLFGAVVANLSNVTDIAMSLGTNSTLDMTRVQEDVDSEGAEVKEINRQLKQLAQQVADSVKNGDSNQRRSSRGCSLVGTSGFRISSKTLLIILQPRWQR